MKSKVNQILDVLKSNELYETKVTKIIELGLAPELVDELFKKYEDDEDVRYTIGVEIECYNVNKRVFEEQCDLNGVAIVESGYNHETRPQFKTVPDSSITGNDPIECVTPILRNQKDTDDLEKVCAALKTAGAKVNKSCGLHVHLGLQKMSFEQYKNIFINYYYLEPAIDKFMAQSRRENGNAYCKSLKNISIRDLREAQTQDEIKSVFSSDRYYKVNATSYQRHQTIEFRQHQGTTDFNKIEAWVMFCTLLANWSKKHTLNDYITEIDSIPFINKSEKNYFNKRANDLK